MNNNLKQQIEAFYNKHRDMLYQYARSLTLDSDRAQDLVHIGIEKFIERVIERGEISRYSTSFIYRCMRNHLIDLARREKLKEDVEIDFGSITKRTDLTVEQDLLVRLFSRLTQDQREVIMLKDVMGYTFKEISRIRETPLFTITSWYKRGMQRLRDGLKGEHHEK